MTFAERLWLDIQKNRLSAEEGFEILIRARPDEAYAQQVQAMPEEMFVQFAPYVSSVHDELSGPNWFSAVCGRDGVTMHAFNFDAEKARIWKTGRVALIRSLCEERASRAQKTNKA
jgi:hypothetical protein